MHKIQENTAKACAERELWLQRLSELSSVLPRQNSATSPRVVRGVGARGADGGDRQRTEESNRLQHDG